MLENGNADRPTAPKATELSPTRTELERSGGGGYSPAMPIYEFHCEKCEQDSEILMRSSHWAGTKCPRCGSMKLAKKFSTFASASTGGGGEAPSCSGMPSSCGMCGTGKPHRH